MLDMDPARQAELAQMLIRQHGDRAVEWAAYLHRIASDVGDGERQAAMAAIGNLIRRQQAQTGRVGMRLQ